MTKPTLIRRDGDKERIDALYDATRSLIQVNGGQPRDLIQLCSYVNKASRFLFPSAPYYRDNHEYAQQEHRKLIGIQAAVFMKLMTALTLPDFPTDHDAEFVAR
jgi:hypothetical protein